MKRAPLVLVDGHNLLWRGAFGFPARIASRDGTDRTGTFAFFALLRVAQRELPARSEVVVCFNGQFGATARRSSEVAYKSNRDSADISPILALPDVKRGLDLCEVPWSEIEDQEGDDLIATLASRHRDREVVVFSADRDFFQLLDGRVSVFNQAAHPGRRQIHAQHVIERFGVKPGQWCDFRALTGDPADAIPGVKGCGVRSAARLLAGDMTLERLPASGRLQGVIGDRIAEAWQHVLRWRDLIRLRIDVPLDDVVGCRPTQALPRPADMLHALDLW